VADVKQEARQAGLSVTAEDLQAAADAFRRAHGLHTASSTRAWLDGQGLTAGDFESGLEERLLAANLKHHQTAAQAVESFSARRTDFERLQVAQVLVDRDDLALELASQVQDEGRDLEEVRSASASNTAPRASPTSPRCLPSRASNDRLCPAAPDPVRGLFDQATERLPCATGRAGENARRQARQKEKRNTPGVVCPEKADCIGVARMA